MSLLTIDCEAFFDIDTQLRGARLVQSVEVDAFDGPPWSASVRREKTYDVLIDPGPGTVGYCECVAFERSGPCKHMWATLCVLDIQLQRSTTTQRRPKAPSAPKTRRTRNRRSESLEVLPPSGALDSSRIAQIRRAIELDRAPPVDLLAAERVHAHFMILSEAGVPFGEELRLVPVAQDRDADGGFGAPIPLSDRLASPSARSDVRLREWLVTLDAVGGRMILGGFRGVTLPPHAATAGVLSDIARAGALYLAEGSALFRWRPDKVVRIELDTGAPLVVVAARTIADDGSLSLAITLEQAGVPIQPTRAVRILGDDRLLIDARIFDWQTELPRVIAMELLQYGELRIGAAHAAEFEALLVPPTELPVAPAPTPMYVLFESLFDAQRGKLYRGSIGFRYRAEDDLDPDGGVELEAEETSGSFMIDGVLHLRDVVAERGALQAFEAAGGVLHHEFDRPVASVPVVGAIDRMRALATAGFEIWAGGDRVRALRAPTIRVSSGVDWFDVEAEVRTHDGTTVEVPELLSALQGQQRGLVRLRPGEVGIVDGDLAVLESLRRLGKSVDGKLRLRGSQGFLLDALLRSREVEMLADAKFAEVRQVAERGLRPVAMNAPKGFGAELRPYQREGLGWFDFLRQLGLGGCLADDMGLGKTVQVLALLERERRRRPRPGPSLVVAPSSLVFHWQREAERFAPKLRVLVFVGGGRFAEHAAAVEASFASHDLVLTTYGTLRNDIHKYEHIEWHYAVLDESQAIKNEQSLASKAARAIRARHRLALSGTPIENHLGELWSLFEFLNPGMLGVSSAFRELLAASASQSTAAADDATRGNGEFTMALRGAVRPFLLRRTKAQVLTELPAKSVQVLHCELGDAQRKRYGELAAFYRANLLGEIPEGAVPDNLRFQVLEALLRLRQAACHPGLLDPARVDDDCAKFDVLWPMLTELRDEGHKALVFSQFPSFLALLRARLDVAAMPYAYLDGQTRRRREEVDRFQEDPDCGLFLISLKAGGYGLNLTAASYVFLLDPWWNPAAEDQAIDRAHRIGQNRNVHAYRLICHDTVEQRVAELQRHKRAIADAVLGDDRSVLQELSAADVAALLA